MVQKLRKTAKNSDYRLFIDLYFIVGNKFNGAKIIEIGRPEVNLCTKGLKPYTLIH